MSLWWKWITRCQVWTMDTRRENDHAEGSDRRRRQRCLDTDSIGAQNAAIGRRLRPGRCTRRRSLRSAIMPAFHAHNSGSKARSSSLNPTNPKPIREVGMVRPRQELQLWDRTARSLAGAAGARMPHILSSTPVDRASPSTHPAVPATLPTAPQHQGRSVPSAPRGWSAGVQRSPRRPTRHRPMVGQGRPPY
jgi:hypothetical protein